MGRGAAAIVGLSEWKPARRWEEPMFGLDALARFGAELVEDSGLDKSDIDGFAIRGGAGGCAGPMAASAVAEKHLGMRSRFNGRRVDLGGATRRRSRHGLAGGGRRSNWARVCQGRRPRVLCPAIPRPRQGRDGSEGPEGQRTSSRPIYMGGDAWGSPQAQFEVPAGLVGATPSYAMIARLYMDTYGLDEETLAKIAVEGRATLHQGNSRTAIFHGRPITLGGGDGLGR